MNHESASEEIATSAPAEWRRSDRLLTVPNVLCGIRLVGSFVLAGVAVAGESTAFLWLFIGLMSTDWIDGKLAILLDQRSEFGARLDSWADGALYCGLLFGTVWLHATRLVPEAWWIGIVAVSYAVSVAASFLRFGCWPSYHSRMAKTSWLLLTIGTVAFLAEWSVWPLRLALLSVILTNGEHLIVTMVSREARTDIGSLRAVLRAERDVSRSLGHRE